MTDFSRPLNDGDLKKAKTFYDLLCWGGLLIVLLPVGIANVVLGYMMGDSPCTLCWGQRQQMAFIGVTALFMVRYGMKPRYLATMLIMAATGLYMSFRHLGNHAARDIGQGFGLDILGIHTQFWAEIVFWCVVFLFGLALFLAPRFDALVAELKGASWRPMTRFMKVAFWTVTVIIGSNAFQALWSTGLPPNWGQGSPVRFSMNPKYVIWTDESWEGLWQEFSFLGKRNVKDPDFAYRPNDKTLGLKFNHDAASAPVAVDATLSIASSKTVSVSKPLNTLSLVHGTYAAASKYDFYLLNSDGSVAHEATIDPWYDTNVLDLVGITEFGQDGMVLMGMNKSVLRVRQKDNADPIAGWANFTRGATQFEKVGGLGRDRIDTERAKFSYVHASATDSKYIFTATVPDNLNKKKFVISKALMQDWTLSGEFVPDAQLKAGRTLGELYVTGMVYEDGKLYAVSKNFNVIVVIDVAKESVVRTYALPAELTDIRGLVKKGDSFEVLDHNRIVTLK